MTEQQAKNNYRLSVRKILKEMEIKQVEFAEMIGMSPTLFSNKMTIDGFTFFNIAVICQIADELGEYVEDMCSGEILKRKEVKGIDKNYNEW